MWPGMIYHGGGYGVGYGIGGGLMQMVMLVFWALIIAGVILLVRRLWEHAPHQSMPCGTLPAKQDNALEVLKRRYASGEITREEYLQIKSDLD